MINLVESSFSTVASKHVVVDGNISFARRPKCQYPADSALVKEVVVVVVVELRSAIMSRRSRIPIPTSPRWRQSYRSHTNNQQVVA